MLRRATADQMSKVAFEPVDDMTKNIVSKILRDIKNGKLPAVLQHAERLGDIKVGMPLPFYVLCLCEQRLFIAPISRWRHAHIAMLSSCRRAILTSSTELLSRSHTTRFPGSKGYCLREPPRTSTTLLVSVAPFSPVSLTLCIWSVTCILTHIPHSCPSLQVLNVTLFARSLCQSLEAGQARRSPLLRWPVAMHLEAASLSHPLFS